MRERERLVEDGGERRKGRGGGDRYLFRAEEDGEEEKGAEMERRDWLTAGLRQGPRLATGGRCAEHQAACSTHRVVTEVPALAGCRTTGVQGERSQAIQAALSSLASPRTRNRARTWLHTIYK